MSVTRVGLLLFSSSGLPGSRHMCSCCCCCGGGGGGSGDGGGGGGSGGCAWFKA